MVHKTEMKRTLKVEFVPYEVQRLGEKFKHNWHDRGSHFEMVRIFGDQVDSRVRVDLNGDAHWTFWVEGEGTTEEKSFKVKDVKEMKRVLTEANKMFNTEVRARGENPSEW